MDELIGCLKERLRYSPAIEMDAYTVRSNDQGDIIPPYPPRPPVAPEVVDDVERTLGFPLPNLVRRLYTEVADGRYGPAWGILRLRSPEGTDILRWWEQPMSVEAWAELYRREMEDPEIPAEHKSNHPPRSIRFCEEGCNISTWLDCSTEAARIFVNDPNQYGADYEHETAAESLEEWLVRWLDQPWPTERY